MDSVTHALLGAVTAQLGFRQRIGRDATWIAAFAAASLDLDILITPAMSLLGLDVNSMTSLKIHRGITHSLMLVPLYSLLVAYVWWRARRSVLGRRNNLTEQGSPPLAPFRWLLGCVLLATLSHPLLDACTSYGTELLAPFSNRRFGVDSIPIVDLIYTPILIFTLLACYIVRKIGRPRDVRTSLILGWAGFLLSIGYITAGRCMHNIALERGLHVMAQRQIVQPGQKILQADAYPSIGSIFLWRVVVETPDRWAAARVHLFARDESAIRAQSGPKVENMWVEKARAVPDYHTFNWFTMGHTRATYDHLNGYQIVDFMDMRYGQTNDSLSGMWVYRVTFDGHTGQLRDEGFAHSYGQSTKRTLRSIWLDLWHP